ncbi:MarR family winged helix-turn-helix transcriptional regulator [Microbacterium wangruii]|uniref:MarR family winged helix-turn-helix transcriptional regulator n=1 Tax=Microbacterium wangruii TaxID=3049073 RepID=UPI00256F4748|nr:MarR family transcriptional regulator [Microbacterium sp. zg-Y1211]MDL5485605.1 MarR family transcriptional regulator [Microbacterium sp. zg-Y1211]
MTEPQHTDERAIDGMLCFSLYAASRATTQVYRRLLKPSGLTYPQYLVLLELWEHESLTVSDLGRDLALDSGTLSPLLSRLENLGHVARTRSTADARVVTIALTASGRALRAELAHVPGEVFRCMAVSPATARAMLANLRAYTDAVEASNIAASV